MMYAKMKPKAEVYQRAEYDTKTRNIISLSLPVFFFLQVLQAPLFDQMIFPGFDSFVTFGDFYIPKQYNCIMKFNPCGYVGQLMETILKMNPGENMLFYMADNLYIASRTATGLLKWVSYDGVKMESAHTQKDIDEYIEFLL